MTFSAGDLVLLIDGRGRRYLITLEPGGAYHSHHGPLPHDEIIGAEEGVLVASSKGRRFRALRPTLADYVLKMPRGATVVYPKDVGPIVVWGDIFPGARVLEAGTGSGSLTLALLRAVGPKGTVHTLERREDHQRTALRNIERFVGSDPSYGTLDARLADLYTDPLDIVVDRVVLDVTEPWMAVDNLERALRPGGILTVYMPTVPQVQRMAEALDRPGWGMVQTFETLHRTWKVEGLSVRPDHRMVAHTAWLMVARRVGVPEA
ncbi:MAG TPA: tRNA (adenine-N1)-methyltransferase [Actinomycetota bacterium]|nr:tRNA (adenine-N1)-methyltransferase [Actinomycetota bacterium]